MKWKINLLYLDLILFLVLIVAVVGTANVVVIVNVVNNIVANDDVFIMIMMGYYCVEYIFI